MGQVRRKRKRKKEKCVEKSFRNMICSYCKHLKWASQLYNGSLYFFFLSDYCDRYYDYYEKQWYDCMTDDLLSRTPGGCNLPMDSGKQGQENKMYFCGTTSSKGKFNTFLSINSLRIYLFLC